MKQLSISTLAIVLLTLLSSSPVHAIKKCKDADGNWHYGDLAVAACKQSKITTLNDRGYIESERSAPKTEQELKAEADALAKREAEEKIRKAEEAERFRILTVYENESDIDRQRDNQLNSVDSNIAVHKAYLKSMDAKVIRLQKQAAETKGKFHREKLLAEVEESKKRIDNSGKELQKLVGQKKIIMDKFATEKEVYIELKNKAS